MDVTPRELREIDIRETLRGYHREDVEELLERSAATIEALHERVRQLSEQVKSAEGQTGQSKETEDMLHRTLLLAQRAADEAIAEAQIKARQTTEEAEARASATVVEAETTARRQAELERRRLESEILDLGARREALLADVESLETFEQDYRARLRRSVESDLELLATQAPSVPAPRPTIHNVDIPAVPEGIAQKSAPPPVARKSPERRESEPSDVSAKADAPKPQRAPEPVIESAKETEPTWEPLTASPLPDAPDLPKKPVRSEPLSGTRAPLFDQDPPTPDALDDDAFFASLREAVTDQTPLGPRDDADYEDEDASKSGGGLFRRRGR
ncbi:MAG TPA: DivIVA domain-containing protein [Acidimicrobiia bacterium]